MNKTKWILKTIFSTALISLAGNSVSLQAVDESIQVQQMAEKITVRIISDSEKGSGIIIERNSNFYTVLTNWHVVDAAEQLIIQTSDGQSYPVNKITRLEGADLAIVYFTNTSNNQYSVAQIGESLQLTSASNSTVYLFGYPASENIPYFYASQLIGIRPQPEPSKCGQLTLGIKAPPGMSGSPVLNHNGQLIGIYCGGQAIFDATYAIAINLVQNLIAQAGMRINWSISNSVSPSLTPSTSISPKIPASIPDSSTSGSTPSRPPVTVPLSKPDKPICSGYKC